MNDLAAMIRAVPDFPRAGVMFRDVTPLLADPVRFAHCIEAMAAPWRELAVQAIAGVEARGFIFGVALARALNTGFVPLRKSGKLPPPVATVEYQLEYGIDQLQVQRDAFNPAQRVLLVDDVLATGGTLIAAATLIEDVGARLLGASVVIELTSLAGRRHWGPGKPLYSLLQY